MKCKKCNIEKNPSDFYTNYLHCKECHKKIQLCIHNKQKSSCRECKGNQQLLNYYTPLHKIKIH